MKAAWLENGMLSFEEDVPDPVVNHGEALVGIILAGICNTDLELLKGYYPFTGIPGHEFVGRVINAPGYPEKTGERVVGSINAVCHSCDMCMKGSPGHCRYRTVLGISGRNGVFAEYTTLPVENLVAVPDHVENANAVFAEPLAAALRVAEQVEIAADSRIIVVGAGKLGQLISEVLMIRDCRVETVAKYAKQRDRMEKLGIPCLRADECQNSSCDLVVEATGSPGGLDFALGLVRPGGTLVLKSTYKGKAEVDFSRVVVDEVTILGSRCGPVPKAMELLSEGRINPGASVESVFPLEEVTAAFASASGQGAGKIILKIAEPGESTN
jgi:threonine dehydrogenase-like Zn-dependent dehydrogenase